MQAHFDLIITTDDPSGTAEFCLRDARGGQVAYRKTEFEQISVSHRKGLFDLGNYLRLYVEEGEEHASIANIGVCIAEDVLGKEIFAKLWESQSQRTLRIQLPGAGETGNYLAAALTRVPWEIARPSAAKETLAQRNLLVRVVHDIQAPGSTPIELEANEPLRVLFVFAESRGSRPLSARKERRELLRLFEEEIYPRRQVVAHFLTHGVTRERLSAQIREHGGYHVVHWSGHGHMNRLELCKPGGEKDLLSGAGLLELFKGAGGFLPRLVFLSACNSGDVRPVKDWNDFLDVAQGKEPGTKEAFTKGLVLEEQPGYTGTAHALLQGGVPSVVAMRYRVADYYARKMALEFYRALLAHAQPKNVAVALTMARQAMMDGARHAPDRFHVCDHATPVLYGEEQPGIAPAQGRSPMLNPRNPRLHQISELTTSEHEHFVGRTWELVALGSGFIGSRTGTEVKPVAVIAGLGGMGKTALTAEALSLWESCFEWVLLYQAKPNRLEFEATLRDIHRKLMDEVGRQYHKHVRDFPADAIYREASADFTGPARIQRLTRNLLRALRDEPILVVLDNFETNLKPADPMASHSACQDKAWDDCLGLLARGLVGSPSRVLITCRRPLAALSGGVAHSVVLGPLTPSEAALYLKEQPTLDAMVFSENPREKDFAVRLLKASRFHPLLMDRLARLASQASLRSQLLAAIETLETTRDFAQLPALFAVTPGDAKELAYLDNALASSLDQVIRNSSPNARRLLWIIATANQPESFGLVKGVWSRESHESERRRQIRQMLDNQPLLPEALQAKLEVLRAENGEMVNDLPPKPPASPDVAPLLAQLVSVGLVTELCNAPNQASLGLTCHELVRERILAWMKQHPKDRADLTENTIRLAYAERLEAAFQQLQYHDMSTAVQAGIRALEYYVQAGAWDSLRDFSSRLVISAKDSRLLKGLVPHLETAVESAPEGQLRWSCLGALADALRLSSHPERSLHCYEQAAAQARIVAEAGCEDSRQAWLDLGWICGNWASAHFTCGNLIEARRQNSHSVQANKRAGMPAVVLIGNEIEAFRIDIEQGNAATALSELKVRLAQLEVWWQQHRSGQSVPEAPEPQFLVRVLVSALDIAARAHCEQEDLPSALRCVEAILEIKRAGKHLPDDIGATGLKHAQLLGQMQRFEQAKDELEALLPLFREKPDLRSKALTSLANCLHGQGAVEEAITQQRRALVIFEQLPNPADRAISHHNLANCLADYGEPSAVAESSRHRLAALLYAAVASPKKLLERLRRDYELDFRRVRATCTVPVIPRVAELLADPAFAPLAQWLRQREVNVDELQADVDRFVQAARKAT